MTLCCAWWEVREPESCLLYTSDVTMPEEYMGDVIGDINSRRGRIEGMEDVGLSLIHICTKRKTRNPCSSSETG